VRRSTLTALLIAVCFAGLSASSALAAPAGWTSPILIDPSSTTTINAISCPSTALCVGVDDNGNLMTSSNPQSGAAAWTVTDVDGDGPSVSSGETGTSVTGISCPLTSLCVAVDANGNVLTSTDPADPAGDWSVGSLIGDGTGLTGITCASASLCVAVDQNGNAYTSTDPTAGAGAWVQATIDQNGLTGVSCPSTTLCVAVDVSGGVVSSSNPTGGAGAWSLTDVDGQTSIDAISCASSAQCVASDDDGNVLVSTNPSNQAGAAWEVDAVDAGGVLERSHRRRRRMVADAHICNRWIDGNLVSRRRPLRRGRPGR